MESIMARAGNYVVVKPDAEVSIAQIMGEMLRALQLRFGAAAHAHARRRANEAVGRYSMRDTGLPPETATGIQSWQADLPFFMQSGFGGR